MNNFFLKNNCSSGRTFYFIMYVYIHITFGWGLILGFKTLGLRSVMGINNRTCLHYVPLIILQGWQRKLDPGYNVMDTLQTLLLKDDWAKSRPDTIDRLMTY